MEEEYANEFASASCMETLINTADQIEKYLTCYGLPNQVGYAFMVLFTTKPKEEITKHLTEAVVKDGKDRMGEKKSHIIGVAPILSEVASNFKQKRHTSLF